ncbi:MAG: thioesterase family protein [Actinobacteria bacterium]|nr:thioesterase family protein [Actinomycetota bacterium]
MIDVRLADLITCCALREVGEPAPSTAPAGSVVCEGDNLDIGYHRIFGGQILAQLIVAAGRAVPDKTVKSLHVLFPREGDAARPLRYRVAVAHTGRTFASLQIVAAQEPDARVVAVATVSMHAPESGLDHDGVAAPVDGPDDAVEQRLDMIPWEVRVVDDVDLGDRSIGPAKLDWWMRAPASGESGEPTSGHPPLLAPGTIDQALLAYATDLTIIGTALRSVEGYSQADSTVRLTTAVTSHTLWFHRRFAVTDWLRIAQTAPVLAGARAFGHGDVFSQGHLVASFAQESMIRTLDQA